MEKNEHLRDVIALAKSLGLTLEELVQLWNEGIEVSKDGLILSLLPVVYKNGNKLIVEPGLDPARTNEVWGMEIFKDTVLAKKCGTDGNVRRTDWYSCSIFAETFCKNGKDGYLPFRRNLRKNWSWELRGKIRGMDDFFCKNGVDGEQKYYGICHCYEVDNKYIAYYFDLANGYNGHDSCRDKLDTTNFDRLAVSF